MIIQNFHALAYTDLRKRALLIAEAGLQAALISQRVKERISLDWRPAALILGKEKVSLQKYNGVFVIGFGKAAARVVNHLVSLVGDKVTRAAAFPVHGAETD